MKKMIINGVEFCNFGSINYSDGMELVTAYPCYDGMVQDVLDGKYPGVYLNPSAPCGEEFFGVFGTERQYRELYKHQVDCQISKKMIDEFGWKDWPDVEITRAYEKKLQEEYKDWWNK